MTGNCLAEVAGRKTLIVRQASVFGTSSVVCGHSGPNFVASRTPLQCCAGCGSRQRSLPTGGAAKGIPLKLTTPPASTPRTCPLSIRTTGALVEVDCADAAPSIAAAVRRTAKKYLKFLVTRGSSQWGWENGYASAIFARSHRPVDGANVRFGSLNSRKPWTWLASIQ